MNRNLVRLSTLLLLSASGAWAAGTSMPWDNGLQALVRSMTGPTAWAIGVLAVAGVGLAVHHHQEIGHVFHGISKTAIAIGAAVGAVALVATFYGISGAVV